MEETAAVAPFTPHERDQEREFEQERSHDERVFEEILKVARSNHQDMPLQERLLSGW